MKRFFSLLLILSIIAAFTACGKKQDGGSLPADNGDSGTELQQTGQSNTEQPEESGQAESNPAENSQTEGSRTESNPAENSQTESNPAENSRTEGSQTESSQTESEEKNDMTMNIQIGEYVLTAALVQNSSTEALIEMLSEGPVTIEMNDYAGMEKVGPFPQSLPRNDEQINTDAGDLILYQGNSFVIYYDTNSWNFTRLGRIDNVTKQELKDILGSGSVTAVLSLPTE